VVPSPFGLTSRISSPRDLPKASARAHPVHTSDAGFMNVTTPELEEKFDRIWT
jgi:hypothetical protein